MITDKQMHGTAIGQDQWLIEDAARGAGRFMGRITARGERTFYFRYTTSSGQRDTLPIGTYDPKGQSGLKLADARLKAAELSRLYQTGVKDVRAHLLAVDFEAKAAVAREARRLADAEEAALQERLQQVSVRQLFERWATSELAPHLRTDGRRIGRKDAGKFTRALFERRVFPLLGDIAVPALRKSDVLAVLDGVRAEGRLRTTNVILTDLKQMLRFAVAREIISHSPIEGVTKRQAGGKDAERERVLSPAEISALVASLPAAKLNKRIELAIFIVLSTACRIGELFTAQWQHVDLKKRIWHLPDTKNQRPHNIHLSRFAVRQFKQLLTVNTSKTWLFPNAADDGPLSPKSFGKQVTDRQRAQKASFQKRSTATNALMLAGGKWTAHDLRRTAATTMATIGVSSDVIDECLNHLIQSRVTRTYIRDRREKEQALAFNALGKRLDELSVTIAVNRRVVGKGRA